MTVEERRVALHDKAVRLAFRHYLRSGRVPAEVKEVLAATESLEALWKYNPDQPRVPRGNPEGGQWTDGGGRTPHIVPVAYRQPQQYAPDTYIPYDKNPKIPGYKRELVKRPDWDAFNRRMRDMGIGPVEQFAFRETFAAEGGMLRDQEGTAVAGILKATLDGIYYVAENEEERNNRMRRLAQILVSKLEGHRQTTQLTPANVADIYQYLNDWDFRNVGGSRAINRIGNPYAAAMLADAMIRHGSAGGAKIAQQAINSVLRANHMPGAVPVADSLTEGAFATYSRLAQHPRMLGQLLDTMAEERKKYLLSKKPTVSHGDIVRGEHFRFVRERGGRDI